MFLFLKDVFIYVLIFLFAIVLFQVFLFQKINPFLKLLLLIQQLAQLFLFLPLKIFFFDQLFVQLFNLLLQHFGLADDVFHFILYFTVIGICQLIDLFQAGRPEDHFV